MFTELQNDLSRFRSFLERALRRLLAAETIVPITLFEAPTDGRRRSFDESSLTAVIAKFGMEGAAEFIAAGCLAPKTTEP
jgi:hypothetical protein